MSSVDFIRPGGWLSAVAHLFWISARRLVWSRQTFVCAALLALATLGVVAWTMYEARSPKEFIEEIALTLYIPFLLPVFCLTYGTAAISSERDEQTLVYLLVSPLPRPLIYLAKFAASLLLAMIWSIGGLALLCFAADEPGGVAMRILGPSAVLSTLAYVALFSLFSVLFRRATILALVYALFFEILAGNMPGIVKRVAISYYGRCMVYDAGAEVGIGPAGLGSVPIFVPISGAAAQSVLVALSIFLVLLGIVLFSRREFAN